MSSIGHDSRDLAWSVDEIDGDVYHLKQLADIGRDIAGNISVGPEVPHAQRGREQVVAILASIGSLADDALARLDALHQHIGGYPLRSRIEPTDPHDSDAR